MTDHRYSSIAEVSTAIRQGRVTPAALAQECLGRIQELQPTLGAFITVLSKEALEDAKQADQEIKAGNWKGPLHGIPVAIKDFFDTAGIKTTAATAKYKERVPSKDAVVVARLREAGAIVVGKTNMHELGMGTTSVDSFFGSVHNPWQLDHVAGGSSGGSAAAVATGLCYATVDTDAIGSCRLPAACSGVTGFKATYGLISTEGILAGEEVDPMILWLNHTALTCRSADDAALLVDVLAAGGRLRADDKPAPERPRLGIVKNFKASAPVRKVFDAAVEVFRALGYAAHATEVPFERASFKSTTKEEDRRTSNETLFHDRDLLLLPTTTDVTPTIEVARAGGPQAVAADNTFFCNYFGLPAMSIPGGFARDGLPIGIQIVGPQGGERAVLDLARHFQSATQWHTQHPALARS
jgi:aspartyl-tRNA(Asn)/glutamyl-tRNA(Gln) amidotransferase subunit A